MRFVVMIERDDDGYFVATRPALPGCHSQGATRDEAVEDISEAIRGFVISMRKHGEPVPTVDQVTDVEVTV